MENRDRILKLPFPCVNLMGAYVLSQYTGVENPFSKGFDPMDVAIRSPIKLDGLYESWTILPDTCVKIRPITEEDESVEQIFDQVTQAAVDLIQAARRYANYHTFSPGGKKKARIYLQSLFIQYQLRSVWKLKTVMRKYVYKRAFPGVSAPLMTDPSLAWWQVGIPEEAYPMFDGKDAIFLRHPVLKWIYRMEPIMIQSQTISLSPLVFDQIGGDVDGDPGYVTPIPRDLDYDPQEDSKDEQGDPTLRSCPDRFSKHYEALEYSEAMKLVGSKDLSENIISTGSPANVPALSLESLMNGGFCEWMGNRGVRSYKNPLSGPLDPQTLCAEIQRAPAAFSYEKGAIRRTDAIRRNLLIVMGTDEEVLQSVNAFCSGLSQQALDSGKHTVNCFPIEDYTMIFNRGEIRAPNGRRMKSPDVELLKQQLRRITNSNIDDGEFILEKLAEQYPEFPQLGLPELVEKYYPLWAIRSTKEQYTGYGIPSELGALSKIDIALAGPANLFW